MTNSIIIIIYFIVLITLGFYFRKRNKTSNDFFYGSGKIPWTWVGISAFVSQFSASSFTIIAGQAYTDGFSVLIIYWASALSFIIAALYFAPKLRQLNIANPVEAVRMRFGKTNEKILALLSIPNYLIFPALWVNALAVFISGAFNINTTLIIIIIGTITIVMSSMGGSWTIVSSDFIQFIIIASLGISTAVVSFGKIGGISGLLKHIPTSSIVPNNMQLIIFAIWAVYMASQKFLNTNCILNTIRFNAVENSTAARKAAWLAAIIYVLGSFIWFVPAWASSILIPNIQEVYPNLTRPTMAAYLAFVQSFMPAGMVGLSVAALFAATMSSVDSSLNWCAGFITRSFYKTHKDLSTKKDISIARIYTAIFGIITIIIALYYETLKTTSLFDLTFQLITYVYIPTVIPMFLVFWIKKTPDWSFPITIIFGFIISMFLTYKSSLINNTITHIASILNMEKLSSQDIRTVSTFVGLLFQIFFTGGFFIASRMFFKGYSTQRNPAVHDFYTRLATPITKTSSPSWIKESKSFINTLAILIVIVMLEVFFLLHISLILFLIVVLFSIVVVFIYSYYKKQKSFL